MKHGLFLIVTFIFCLVADVSAQELSSLRLCTQNLKNYGVQDTRQRPKTRETKRRLLTKRIVAAGCDVIAVQEVGGASKAESQQILDSFAQSLSDRSQRKFRAYVGNSWDKRIRNGFLVAEQAGEVLSEKSYWRHPLPKLDPLSPTSYYSRGPFGIVLKTAQKSARVKTLFIVNFHFKSKYQGWSDPAGMNFELRRMEMAQGLRNVVQRELESLPAGTVPVLLGDRNSEEDSASAQILAGVRELDDFTRDGGCEVNEELRVLCKVNKSRIPSFTGLFEYRNRKLGSQHKQGSYNYKGRWELIDEILVREKDLWMFSDGNGRLTIGIEGLYRSASDHQLLWAALALK